MNNSKLVRGALLVALALALQSLRLVLPMPQLLSTFIIGTLVHMMLVLTLQLSGLKTALLLAFLLPLTAYVQGQVLLPFLIPVIWLGNFIFVLLVRQFKDSRKLSLSIPPLAKACVMLLAAWAALSFLALPNPALRKTVMFAMSVPQLLTAVAGILLAEQVKKRLRQFD
ncbi:hypothetical protein [Phascolarctobacterium succinatutens]|jgi:putative membrane protein|uniref:ECF transporter S component n=1 Tax=Phascolarctobacterium succinatutens YIT 12067 TaxID=626939 RepID=E8LG67_9FIRM|nr:hypothetical protein [Phascolarctobacterium succinatutens]MBP7223913.1 hypothetical protein [Phascolarctobacterium sp.]EFY04186.1 hypothetical protein HMPREF9443_01868 [Phascolarctobacterium succinatutens YIT 12067]MCI6544704.1 hypothetical protein [Phascolarctobacterium succinatutens]MDD7140510.1 hypothetical protein [Phascolarctobacterium succinatutens]MDY3839633.1 hypothetical protein [Phascolarctobacterium succinatutens]